MAKNKKSFLLYADIKHTVDKLTDENAGKLFKHLLAYVNDENPTPENDYVDIAFEPIKQSLKRDLKKYESIVEKRSRAGKLSAEKRKQKSTHVNTCQQSPTNPTDNDSVNVSDSDIIISNFKNSNQDSVFMQLGIDPELINKYKSEFTARVISSDKKYNKEEFNLWWYNWLKKQPKRNLKYLTKEEKERRQVPIERDYIFWDGTYKMLKEDNKGLYIEHNRQKTYL